MDTQRKSRRFGIVCAAGLVGLLGMAGVGIAPQMQHYYVDIFWVVHESTDCRWQEAQVTWDILGEGHFIITGEGSSQNGITFDGPDAYTRDLGTIVGLSTGGPETVYTSPCFPTAGENNHGRDYAWASLQSCGISCNERAFDDADCHWGHDAYCAENSGT